MANYKCLTSLRRLLSSFSAYSGRVGSRQLSSSAEEKQILQGCVQSVRRHKSVVFISVLPPNKPHPQQIVASREAVSEQDLKAVSYGATIQSEGRYVPSPTGAGLEFHAHSVQVLGACDSEEYPFKVKAAPKLEYLRKFPHLRPRTPLFSAIMRVRSAAAGGVIKHLMARGCSLVHTPVLTSHDCEGAGEVFTLQDAELRDEGQQEGGGEQDQSGEDRFFPAPVHLTVSGQLHAEALAMGLSNVFTLGPAFRSDRSHTRRHLAEFYMVEVELCYTSGLGDLLSSVTSLYRELTRSLLDTCREDIAFVHSELGCPDYADTLHDFCSAEDFNRISYTEAVELLQKQHTFSENSLPPPEWGNDFSSKHEEQLLAATGNQPLIVTRYPKDLKPFYALPSDDNPELVECFDLLVPGVGELAGGSLREDRPDALCRRLEEAGLLEDYQWYLDLRRFGSVPHGGYGMGFERYLQHILNLEHIRDTIAFPRLLRSCPM